MTREELRKHCEWTCDRYREAHFKGLSTAYEEHKLILDLLNQTEWIPVSERLPKEGENIIFYDEDLGVCCGSYFKTSKDCFWDDFSCGDAKNVLAWMPFPSPYKGDEE